MYTIVLFLHALLRWVVLAAGLFAAVRGISGWRSGRPWTLADDRAALWFTSALDLQMLLGLLMCFWLSPITTAALHDFGAAMSNSGLRFWAIEHPIGMILGIALAHVGRGKTKRSTAGMANDARRHRTAAIFFTLSLIIIAASIPWPGSPNGRPLLRGW
jgi:hypothetical protein